MFNWWVSFAPDFQCCYFCESSCLLCPHTGFSADPVGIPLLVCMISLESVCGISPNLHGYIIRTSLRAGVILMTLTSFSRSQEVTKC